jgi:hypothetical protein
MVLARSFIVLGCFAFGARQALAAEPFLQKQSGNNETLLTSLQAVFGPHSLTARVQTLEDKLRPMFFSLPKTSQARISHAAARYALHRIALELHGWSISGLEPNATTFNTTSLVGSGILRGLVPTHIEGIFDEHVGVDGFGLQDLAILAATIEHLVHDDQKHVMMKVCELFDLPVVGEMEADDMKHLITFYKAVFLVARSTHMDIDTLTADKLEKLLATAERGYPGWADTVLFLDDERQSLAFTDRDLTNPFRSREHSLQVALRVVERAADHFARRVADPECQEIKDDLLDFERGDTGRIRLADFYRAGLDTRFYFLESKEYLEAVGALDTSDGLVGPKVIVSNYVLAKSNCLAHGHTYSICCINECEGLYGKLEDKVASSDASAVHVAEIIASMSSSTVQAPRNLSHALLRRLEEIADGNNGKVLLHSRLFAQWMHQAFPRECPYPHLAGTTTSLSPHAWVAEHKLAYRIDVGVDRVRVPMKDAMNRQIQALDQEFAPQHTSSDSVHSVEGELMWTAEEEHFVAPTRSFSERAWFALCAASNSVGALALLALIITFAKHASAKGHTAKGGLKEHMFV